jgi:hypothetical protein
MRSRIPGDLVMALLGLSRLLDKSEFTISSLGVLILSFSARPHSATLPFLSGEFL